jgi:2-C-methyl-D-erythritol 4-phosphate cytidylyltransferase
VREITPGGAERQESITNSLKSNFVIDSELILIHDAVRPFATPELITSLLQIAEDEGAVIPVIEPKDTIKEVKKNGVVAKTLDRNQIRCVQTPQIY